jgi:hypothetical protein
MRVYALDPTSTQIDGPFAEVRAWSGPQARQKAYAAFPGDGWLDESRFDCRPLVAVRAPNQGSVTRFANRAALPPVQ